MSHLGRPKGEPKKEFSLAPVAGRLAELLGRDVPLAPDCIGRETEEMVEGMQDGDVLLLENLRFHAEEEKNDPEFAKGLARLADVYINDAFGTAHRAHASTAGVADYVAEKGMGYLIRKELKFLGEAINTPERDQRPAGQVRHDSGRRRHDLHLPESTGEGDREVARRRRSHRHGTRAS